MEELRSQYQQRLEEIDGVQVKAVPLYDTIQGGIRQELPVLFCVMGGKLQSDVQRDPLNVALVLDRSGSMSGEKLENSKKAVRGLIQSLSPQDQVHFLVYDDRVDVIFENTTTETAQDSLQKVDDVRVGGCTNLVGGVDNAVKVLQKHHRAGDVDVLFLFSDGLANSGIQGRENIGSHCKKLHEETGVHLVTYGIGSDFDEQLMASISRVGKGSYFYIDHYERIPELVRRGYEGFTRVLASNLCLKAFGVGGNVLTKLEGCTDLTKGREIRSLREYGFYQFLATVSLNSGSVFSMIGNTPVLRWRLSYKDLASGLDTKLEGSVDVQLVEDFDTPSVTPAPEVVVYQTMVECGEINDGGNKAVRNRNLTEALAIKSKVIEKYKSIQSLDEFGFVAALLQREQRAYKELEKRGITDHSTKLCTVTSACAAPGASYERATYEVDEEGDGDMGYGLFD